MANDINIKNTNRFSEITSYLDRSKSTLSNYETKLNSIGSGLSGELGACYNSAAGPVKAKISALRSKLSSASAHISNSVAVYYLTDGHLSDKLNEIYDSIFNDEEYSTKLTYYASGESDKISYEEFLELVNNSREYFDAQRQKVYEQFLAKALTAGPALIRDVGTSTFNAIVENTYFFISDEEIGSVNYQEGLKNYKNKFGEAVLDHYDNLDFVPELYLEKEQDTYNKALLALSFDESDVTIKKNILTESLIAADSRSEIIIREKLDRYINNSLDIVAKAQNIFKFDANMTAKELYEKYYNDLKEIYDWMAGAKKTDETNSIAQALGINNPSAWFEAIKDTEAYKKYKEMCDELGIDCDDADSVFDGTAHLEFLAAIYEYDGLEGLQKVLYKYNGAGSKQQWGVEITDSVTLKSMIDPELFTSILNYINSRDALKKLYQPLSESKEQLDIIKDNEDTAFLLFAKDLDTSGVSAEDIARAKEIIGSKWTQYCDGNDYTKYLEDWQIAAYALILSHDKDLAAILFNMTEDSTRGILDEKIMEGYAFDVAKQRVLDMTPEIKSQWDAYYSLIFSGAYGFGYGLTGFIDGIADIFCVDGLKNRRQMELENIMSLLAGDYSMFAEYYNALKNGQTLDMLSTDYDDNYIKSLKLKNLSDADIEELIRQCKENNVPKYELEYLVGNITYEEYLAYKGLASTPMEDLEFYASLNNNNVVRSVAEKVFKVSNSVGNMAIPTILNVLAMMTTGKPSLSLLTMAFRGASYVTMAASVFGRTMEEMVAKGETNQEYIIVNSLLHAALEALGEAAFGKILSSPTLGVKLRNIFENIPGLGKILNASNAFKDFLIEEGCNPRLAKYLSDIVGEVIQENGENIVGWGIDALTSLIFKGKAELPTPEDVLREIWETTWVTALSTPILNGFTDVTLSNVKQTVIIAGSEVIVSLSDILLFTDENTNTVDYEALSEYLVKKGQMSQETFDAIKQQAREEHSRLAEMHKKLNDYNEETNNDDDGGTYYDDIWENLEDGKVRDLDNNDTENNNNNAKVIEDITKDSTSIFNKIFNRIGDWINNVFNNNKVDVDYNPSVNLDDNYDNGTKSNIKVGYNEENNSLVYQKDGEMRSIGIEKLLDYSNEYVLPISNDMDQILFDDISLGEYASLMMALDEVFQQNEAGLNFYIDNRNYRVLEYTMQYQNADSEASKNLLYWSNAISPQVVAEFFDYAIDSNNLDNLIGSYQFFTNEKAWHEFLKSRDKKYENEKVRNATVALNNSMEGKRYVYVTNEAATKHNIIHETLHAIGSMGDGSGFNESVTEALAQRFDDLINAHRYDGTNDPSTSYINGYQDGVNALNALLEMNIDGFGYSDIVDTYMENDWTTKLEKKENIKKAIDAVMGEGYFDNTLYPAFDKVKDFPSVSDNDRNKISQDIVNVINDIADKTGGAAFSTHQTIEEIPLEDAFPITEIDPIDNKPLN